MSTKDWAIPSSSRAMCPMVAARGARVILVVHDALCPLLSGLPGVSQCLPFSAGTLPAFDMHCPMSQPAAGVRDEARHHSVRRSRICRRRPRQPRASLGGSPRPPRQIARWPGLVRQSATRQRSQPVDSAASAFADPRRRCDLRQPAKGSAARRSGGAAGARPTSSTSPRDLTDFVETAALIGCLDLVITVDTSVAHLAARARPPDLDPAALHARLSLAARSRRQPLVSDGAAVPAERNPRLRKRARSGAKRTQRADFGQTGNR